jgi:hypothetical protein
LILWVKYSALPRGFFIEIVAIGKRENSSVYINAKKQCPIRRPKMVTETAGRKWYPAVVYIEDRKRALLWERGLCYLRFTLVVFSNALTLARGRPVFPAKDMLPESKPCSEKSGQMRRLLHVRTSLVRQIVLVKNQIHSLPVAIGIEDTKASLQSKRGRQRVPGTLKQAGNELAVQPLFDIIEGIAGYAGKIEDELRKLAGKDRAIELLTSIPVCGEITVWTIMAFIQSVIFP